MSRYRRALEELLKKQSMPEEWTSSLTQYLNKCQDVVMDGPVFCLACQRPSLYLRFYSKTAAYLLIPLCEIYLISKSKIDATSVWKGLCFAVRTTCTQTHVYVWQWAGGKKREREILLTLVFSCLVIDLHAPLVVTLKAVQCTYAHIRYGERKCKRARASFPF